MQLFHWGNLHSLRSSNDKFKFSPLVKFISTGRPTLTRSEGTLPNSICESKIYLESKQATRNCSCRSVPSPDSTVNYVTEARTVPSESRWLRPRPPRLGNYDSGPPGPARRAGAAACQCGQRVATLEFIRLSAAACVGDAGPAWTQSMTVPCRSFGPSRAAAGKRTWSDSNLCPSM